MGGRKGWAEALYIIDEFEKLAAWIRLDLHDKTLR